MGAKKKGGKKGKGKKGKKEEVKQEETGKGSQRCRLLLDGHLTLFRVTQHSFKQVPSSGVLVTTSE